MKKNLIVITEDMFCSGKARGVAEHKVSVVDALLNIEKGSCGGRRWERASFGGGSMKTFRDHPMLWKVSIWLASTSV